MKRKHAKIPSAKLKKQKVNDWNVEESVEENSVLSDGTFSENEDVEDDLEQVYEEQIAKETRKKKNRLPIKTKEGLVRSEEVDDAPESGIEDFGDEDIGGSDDDDLSDEEEDNEPKSVTAMQLFTTQSKILEEKKIQVGSLSAGILENPNEKINNFRTLLNLLNDKEVGEYVIVKKLIIVSLLEIFKDLLPSYKIKQQIDKGVKLKKDTLKLEKYEVLLLQFYKKFLQILERTALTLVKKKGSTRVLSQGQEKLAEISVSALCDLLQAHPYFNYAENIARTIVPFLNHRKVSVRQKANAACKTIFKEDKKGEISLVLLRLINQYAKKHPSNLNPDAIEVLLSLRIKDVNLDDERENLLKQKKLMSHKNNVLQLSKMERKRKARLEELEKELLEVKAEESKQVKKKHQTEITKVAFGLFFRMLKNSRDTKVLGVCLQGIAKFAHCINIEFYVDLINILDSLLKSDWLGYCEQQRCIQTVFVILSQQGEVLNLDPGRFYNGIYENLLTTHASKNYSDFIVILETLTHSLIKRHKKISVKRMASFLKRIVTLSLQLLHNGTLGCLGIAKSLLQLNKTLDILLDMESSPGDGRYLPELNDPEYCNASATALYELSLLNRHYHPAVAEYSKYIAEGVPANVDNNLSYKYGRTTAEQLYELYDMSKMAFCPAVPIPKKVEQKAKIKSYYFSDDSFRQKCMYVVRSISQRKVSV